MVEGLDQDGQGLRRVREEAERASVSLLSGLWDIHVEVPKQELITVSAPSWR